MSKKLEAIGTFECVVIRKPKDGWVQSTETGTHFVCVPVEVAKGPHKGEYAVWRGYITSPKSEEMTFKQLKRTFGFDGDYPGLSSGKIGFEGKPCFLEMQNETYKGKTAPKAAWLNGPPATVSADAAATLVQLAAKRKAIEKSRATAAAPVATDGPPGDEPPADDDVPF